MSALWNALPATCDHMSFHLWLEPWKEMKSRLQSDCPYPRGLFRVRRKQDGKEVGLEFMRILCKTHGFTLFEDELREKELLLGIDHTASAAALKQRGAAISTLTCTWIAAEVEMARRDLDSVITDLLALRTLWALNTELFSRTFSFPPALSDFTPRHPLQPNLSTIVACMNTHVPKTWKIQFCVRDRAMPGTAGSWEETQGKGEYLGWEKK